MGTVIRLLRCSQAGIHLAKAPLCILIGCSALFGFFLADPVVSARAFGVGAGLLFLAMGAATLNSFQEHKTDALLKRTQNRPLPRGTVGLVHAGIQTILLLGAGVLVLYKLSGTIFPFTVALSAVVLYNGIYTPLKQKTILAIIPGAVCGALPPYIGWLMGGGAKISFEPVLLFAIMVLWQVPHFLLVLLCFKEDYKTAELPSLLFHFHEKTIDRFFITWIGGLVFVMILFTILPAIHSVMIRTLIIINTACLLSCFVFNLRRRQNCNYRLLFATLNGALFLHMAIVSVGCIWFS